MFISLKKRKRKTLIHTVMVSTSSESQIGLGDIYMVKSLPCPVFPTAVNWLVIHLGDITQTVTKGWHSAGPL